MKCIKVPCRVLLSITGLAFGIVAVSSLAGPSPLYRMRQLEEVKKREAAEHKPIAWIGTFSKYLAPYDNLMGKSSHAGTAYAIRALQNETILIYSDSETENHQEPAIVDHELHSPNPHYTAPVVVILAPSMEKVIAKILHTPDSQERIRVYTDVLKKIREKSSWEEKPNERVIAPK